MLLILKFTKGFQNSPVVVGELIFVKFFTIKSSMIFHLKIATKLFLKTSEIIAGKGIVGVKHKFEI